MNLSQKFLDIICTNTNQHYDLFSSYMEISQEIKKLNLLDGSLLHIVSPYLEAFSLDLILTDGTLELRMNTGTKTIFLSHFQPLDEVRTLAKEMEQFLDQKHLPLTPFPDESFIQTVLNTEIGDIINLNNRTAILCTKAGNNYRKFQRLFEGSLSDLCIESFNKQDSYTVTTANPQDLHFLYGKAYSSRTASASIRIIKERKGSDLCNSIEQRVEQNSCHTIWIDYLKLTVKKDSCGNITWYHSDDTVNRCLVELLFDWCANTLPELEAQEWLTSNVTDDFYSVVKGGYSATLAAIKSLTQIQGNGKEQAVYEIINKAFRYGRSSQGQASFTFDDLEQDDYGNFLPVTYAFRPYSDKNYIYKLVIDKDSLDEWREKKALEVSAQEFFCFCNKKFDTTYHYFANIPEQHSHKTPAQIRQEAVWAAIDNYEAKKRL